MRIISDLNIEKQTTEALSYDLATGWSKPFPDLDSENTLVVVFAAHEYCNSPEPLAEIRNAFPQSKIIGCSTSVVICNGELLEGSISVGIICFKKIEIRLSSVSVNAFEESQTAGQQLGEQLADDDLKGVLIFSDGVTTEATCLVRGLQKMLPPNVTIVGGLASGHTLDDTWVLCHGELKRFHACAVGFVGKTMELTRATGGGWRLIGTECEATKTSGRTLFELDNEPAKDVYQRQVGNEVGFGLHKSSTRYPLTLRLPSLEMQIVRDVNSIDEVSGAIELAGDIPEGVKIQVMTTTEDEILDGVDEAIERMRSKTVLPQNNALAVCVSCAGRRTVLREKTSEEAALAHDGLGQGIHQIGMYAFGEISTTSSGPPQVHNETITMGLIREYQESAMSTKPLSEVSYSKINPMLDRLMRRQGVAVDRVPNFEGWNNFVLAIDQIFKEFNANRKLLEQSVKSTSLKLKQAYEDLKIESNLRLAQADLHQRELENLVQERTIELQDAQLHLEKINRRLEYDATHDDLTGLANRNQLMRELNRCVAKLGTDADFGLCFFFIDCDRFKQINDRFGHLMGDKVLIQLANRLSVLVGNATCFARLGGDEFVILMDKLDESEAVKLARRINDAFAQPIRIRDTEVFIAASVGIVLADAWYQSSDEVIRDADIAMYRAKAKGNCYQLFDEEMRIDHLEQIELERELEIAVREKQFHINFEPIVNTHKSNIFSFESLVRWMHPEKGIISPNRFIPLAEELGLVIEIDRIVFEKTCQQFHQWRANGISNPNQKCNVNLSCSQLERSDIVPFLLSIIDVSDMSPHDVVLEITESYLLADSDLVMRNLNEMDKLGFSIFVDDFGTGYSSLSYLAKYPIHGIKIDRSFVRDLGESQESKELIRSMIAMAEALNLKVVTEGVETIKQLQIITELGCRYIQGFLFTRPMNSVQAEAFLRDKLYRESIDWALLD